MSIEETSNSVEPIPVTIITGFLGSGKTTLLNTILRDAAFSNSAVLINEFGDVQVDHDLVANFSDELTFTTTGCLCCNASSDIKKSLHDLWEKQQSGVISKFDRVIVETTGLMDPVPVVSALIGPPSDDEVSRIINQHFVLSRLITLFDIVFGPMDLERHEEAKKQVGLADTIVLTKTDLARDPATLHDINQDKILLSEMNTSALILDRHTDWQDIRELFLSPTSYDLRPKGIDASTWLEEEFRHQSHDHSHHNHEINRHGSDIFSQVIFLEEPVTQTGLRRFLDWLKIHAGTDLLRIKGLIALSDDPSRPVIVHGVQHIIHQTERLTKWPGEDHRSKLVLIGRNLDTAAIRQALIRG